MKVSSVDDFGWDGFYNGEQLQSNDYWFNAKLVDPKGNVIFRTLNFSLLKKREIFNLNLVFFDILNSS